MALADKRVLIVVPPRDFDGHEYETTRKVLLAKGLNVTVACTTAGPRAGTSGIIANAQKALKDCKSYDYDAVVFIGGPGAKEMQNDKDVRKFAEDVKYKVVGAFSAAVGVLAASEVVKDKRVTGDRTAAESVRRAHGTYTGQPLQTDGKLVTALDGRYAVHLSNALIEALKGS